VGVVYRVSSSLNAKILRTTSYKAPAALQLYGQPLFDGEVGGNADLKPEQADSTEAQLHWFINKQASLTLGVFNTHVDNKVELLLRRANQVPVNRGAQESHGIEFSMKWQDQDSALTFNGAIQKSDIESFDALGQTIDQSADLYPEQKFSLQFTQKLNAASSMGVEILAISPRRASVSNIALNSGVPYQLDAYQLANVVYNHRFDEVALGLRIDNIFDEHYVEPGFAGIDIPGQARTTRLIVDLFW
jgi:outer membrane receptor protein involved in Fe transport